MNKLSGTIDSITVGAPYASFEISLEKGDFISAIAPFFAGGPHIKQGDAVDVFFDEFDVILAKSFSGETTVKRQFMGVVQRVEKGEAVTRVVLDYKGTLVGALVRTSSWKSLGLGVGDDVLWLVKATDVTVGTM